MILTVLFTVALIGLYARGTATNNRIDSLTISVRTLRTNLIEARQERDALKRPILRNRELMKAADRIEAGELRNEA